jgi:hypothetical protein
MPGRTANVRYWGEIGLNADIGLWAGFDPFRTFRAQFEGCASGNFHLPFRISARGR